MSTEIVERAWRGRVPAFIKSLRTPLAIICFAFGGQKVILDWVDPSDWLGLGIGLMIYTGFYLHSSGWSLKENWPILALVTILYTALDYWTSISGYPWHYWNHL